MSRSVVEISGFKELQDLIKDLADDKSKRRESFALLRQIAKPTLDVAKQLVPVSNKVHIARGKKIQPGNLKKSLGNITSKSKNPTILVGPRAKGKNDGWYGHFVHDGVNIYRKGFKRSRSGKAYLARAREKNSKGALSRSKANPFLRKAFETTEGKVTKDAEQKFEKFLQRRIDKLSK